MKNAVKWITLLYILLILILSVAGSLSGWLSTAVEILAYAIPVSVGYVYSRRLRREREELAGVAEDENTLLSARGMLNYVPLFVPTVALVFLAAWLTSLLLGVFGKTPSAIPNAPIVDMLVAHALVPAVLEELAFRYLPMKLLSPYSKRWCVILSAMFFALAHLSLFQIPYALLAGLIFIIIDLACDSVLPSLVLHFLNNAVSVLWIKWGGDSGFAVWFILAIALLAAISLVFIFFKKKTYIDALHRSLDVGEGIGDAYAPTVFAAATLMLAVFNL